MAYNPHTDLSKHFLSVEDLYDQLRQDQTRDSLKHSRWRMALWFFTLLAAFGWDGRWGPAPWLTLIATVSLERTIWCGREMAHRNNLMHSVTLAKLVDRHVHERSNLD